jgi:hypothetical protein
MLYTLRRKLGNVFVLEREVTTAVLITVSTGIWVVVSSFIQVSWYNFKKHSDILNQCWVRKGQNKKVANEDLKNN